MRVSVSIDDRAFRAFLRGVEQKMPGTLAVVAKALAALGREYARDIITVQIYATPERSGYDRTRMLIRSIYGTSKREGTSHVIIVGASAEYAAYNEFGTYDYAIEPDEVISDARARALQQELVALEYGRTSVDRGLEPRPFIIPAIMMLERDARGHVIEAVRRLTRG